MIKLSNVFTILSTLIFFLIFLLLNTDEGFTNDNKFTPSALSRISQSPSEEIIKYWVYLDGTAVDSNLIALSERSLTRRAKVDPIDFLIDEKDFAFNNNVLQQLEISGLKIRHAIRWFKAVSVEADNQQIQRVAALPFIKKIDLIKIYKKPLRYKIEQIKDDFTYDKAQAIDYGASQFQIEFIKADKLHQAGLSGQGVRIALFDTGFNIFHPAFDSTNIIDVYDFINNDATVDEQECEFDYPGNHQSFHGTATLGVIGTNITGTIMGVAYKAEYLLAKTEISCNDREEFVEEDNWIAAAQWADSLGTDIISSSVGYNEFTDGRSYTFEDLDGNTALITIAADIAASKNILVVNSAGNERLNSWGHIIAPADGDSVIAVGAVSYDSTLAGFSSPGPSADGRIKPDISSLGIGVASVSHLGGLSSVSGTSFSAPMVSGGAALALEHDPSLTAAELANLIRQSGNRKDNPDNDYGYGLFDAVKTADIIKFDPPFHYTINNTPLVIEISTSGRSDSIPVLSAIDLPQGIIFTDFNDGTGTLLINNQYQLNPVNSIKLTADVGYFIDTTELTFINEASFNNIVSMGPNPFSDTINIYIDNSINKLQSLSIYNINGEMVWEKVNNFKEFADVIIEQWDGRNQHGINTAAGVYILLVITDRHQFHLKLLKVDT